MPRTPFLPQAARSTLARTRWLVALAVALAGGCGTVPLGGDAAMRASRLAREEAMNREWQNHRLSELLQTRGEPRQTLTIPGGGNPPGFITVYERDSASGCIDVFTLMYGADPVIRNYYCR